MGQAACEVARRAEHTPLLGLQILPIAAAPEAHSGSAQMRGAEQEGLQRPRSCEDGAELFAALSSSAMITSFFKPKPTSGDDVEAEATGEAAATSASAALAGAASVKRSADSAFGAAVCACKT